MADFPVRMQHTDKSFSVKVYGWHSPRMVALVDGFVYFQASTCFPCDICKARVELLRRALDTGPHSRLGLWGNEVLLNVDGRRTYNFIEINRMGFFILPYAGEDNPRSIAAFLSNMLDVNVTIASGDGGSMQLPLVSKLYNVEPKSLSQMELLDALKRLQGRLLAVSDNEFAKLQAKNQYLLIAALVLHEMDVEKAHDSLVEFANACPEKERLPFRRSGGVGGWDARKVEQILHGYYYNTDTVLYLLHSSTVPFTVSGHVKEAYDLTICSHLNDDLDIGESYFNTTYYGLLTTLKTIGSRDAGNFAQGLPSEVHEALSSIPSSTTSDAEKATWMYTLEDPAVYKMLNAALFKDKEDALRLWMPLILLIKQYANSQPMHEDIVTYRSSSMTEIQFNALRMHCVYRDPKFVSTTRSQKIADDFGVFRGNEYKCEFKIRKNCANAVTLRISQYEDEEEVLLVAYSPLLVTGKDKEKKVVQFAVLGDAETNKHLESGEGRHTSGLGKGYS